MTLSSEPDDDSLFYLVPLENLLKDDASRKYISKDAYFRLQTKTYKKFLSLQRVENEDRPRSSKKEATQQLSEIPGLIDRGKHHKDICRS